MIKTRLANQINIWNYCQGFKVNIKNENIIIAIK